MPHSTWSPFEQSKSPTASIVVVPDVDLGSMPFELEIPVDVVPDVDLGTMPFDLEIPVDSAENGSSVLLLLACIL